MKVSELLAKAKMKPVDKGRNVKFVAWVDGYVLVRFHTGALWVYGSRIPESEAEKIAKKPVPGSPLHPQTSRTNSRRTRCRVQHEPVVTV